MVKWQFLHKVKHGSRTLPRSNNRYPLVIEAIAIYHNIRKSQIRACKANPHTQSSFRSLQLLQLTWYSWDQSFNWTQRKIGAYSFASQLLTSRVMSTIIIHECLPPSWHMNIDLSLAYDVSQDKGEIENWWRSPWLFQGQKVKVQDRPFAEGSRGCHALLRFGCVSS